MPSDRLPPDDPCEWLNRAKSNLIQAKAEHPGVYLEDLCFQAQQTVEKALKALLLHHGIDFPYVHDLAALVRLLQQEGQKVPPQIREAIRLSDYAVEARYPGIVEPVSQEEYQEAVILAERVVYWVEGHLC